MWLYVVGAAMLQLVLLSCAHEHWMLRGGSLSNNMVVYQACFAMFLIEYLYFENVHLYTYDLFAEKLGFKLIWGCFFFYPFVYCLGVWSLVAKDGHELDLLGSVGVVCLYLLGWVFTRGANLQKFYFKLQPEEDFFGIKQETIPNSRILCSGFWGLSRHINYSGEVVQALALSIPGYCWSGSLVPFFYPLYYALLFVGRQIDDDALCAKKYGEAWARYCARVPWRIIPKIY